MDIFLTISSKSMKINDFICKLLIGFCLATTFLIIGIIIIQVFELFNLELFHVIIALISIFIGVFVGLILSYYLKEVEVKI